MRRSISHPTYGNIDYDESFWLGKRSVSINGTPLTKTSKKSFSTQDGKSVTVTGNFVFGVNLWIDGQKFNVVPSPKWYEIVLAVLLVTFIIVWQNVPSLVLTVPIIGGAIGGAICGLMFAVALVCLPYLQQWWLRILIIFVIFAFAFLFCYLGAMIYLTLI